MASYEFQAGDTKPLRVTLKRSTGRAIPLAGLAVQFSLVPRAPGMAGVSGPAVILEGQVIPPGDVLFSAADPGRVYGLGVVEYRWGPGETDARGAYRGRWTITDGAGDQETIPNRDDFNVLIV